MRRWLLLASSLPLLAGFAVRARDDVFVAQRAQKLRRHLALARAAVQRRDDRALHDHRAQ